jgi:hypothetical protein
LPIVGKAGIPRDAAQGITNVIALKTHVPGTGYCKPFKAKHAERRTFQERKANVSVHPQGKDSSFASCLWHM